MRTLLLLLAVAACDSPPIAGILADVGPDVELEPIIPSARPIFPPGRGDAGMPDVGRPDVSVRDAGSDSGCDCPAPMECQIENVCVDGACVAMPAPDGTDCGELSMGMYANVCVGGVCVPRGCGDGYRELGPRPGFPLAPPRESCDDGNVSNADVCSSACQSRRLVVAGSRSGAWTPQLIDTVPAVGVDGAGRVMVVWINRPFSGTAVLEGRILSPVGVPEGPSFAIESDVANYPTIAGLRDGGWVVVYQAIRPPGDETSTRVIAHRVVQPDGTVGPERLAAAVRDANLYTPSVASLDDGFVIAWEDTRDRAEDRHGGVRARRFSAGGAALDSADLLPAQTTIMPQQLPRVATDADGWMVVWEDDGSSGVQCRRFIEGSAMGSEELIAGDARRPQVIGLTNRFRDPLDLEEFVVSFEAGGDPHTRRVPLRGALAEDVVPYPYRESASLAPMDRGDFHGVGYDDAMMRLASTRELPPDESMLLASMINERSEVSMAAGPSGTWVLWIDDNVTGYPTAAVSLFLLPHE